MQNIHGMTRNNGRTTGNNDRTAKKDENQKIIKGAG
jgi:hypothetical protein